MNYWVFVGYALSPFLLLFILWAFRPLTSWLQLKLKDGLVKKILFFSWKA